MKKDRTNGSMNTYGAIFIEFTGDLFDIHPSSVQDTPEKFPAHPKPMFSG